MIPVSSSNLAEVGYDSDKQILYIRFHDGSLYAYHYVPSEVYRSLMCAPSKGKFLHQGIKGIYPYERLE